MATIPPDELARYDTPNISAASAAMIVHASSRIDAPAALVFQALRNTETWKDWNRLVPRVTITYQPPDPDMTDMAEISELVRATSIAGSMDSDLTDGLPNGARRKQIHSTPGEQVERVPLTLRSRSITSQPSNRSNSEDHTQDTFGNPSTVESTNSGSDERGLSGAQKYALAQAARKASLASGQMPTPAQNILKTDMSNQVLATAPAPQATRPGSRSASQSGGSPAVRAKPDTLIRLYGEPSVRVQLNTRMTFYMRMDKSKPQELKPFLVHVTEVARPDDPKTDGAGLTALTRSKTHTLSREARYRIVWGLDSGKASLTSMTKGSAYPKSLLHAERVQEVRPILNGDGTESCEYTTWECQKGPLAKVVKKKAGAYLQEMMGVWADGLKAFCEAQGGKVDRRDFLINADKGV